MAEAPGNVPGCPFSLQPVEVPRVETRHRRIRTSIPSPSAIEALSVLVKCEPRSMYADSPPLAWSRAQGFQISDEDGNQWIDLSSGILVANAGHAHPHVVAAMKQALERPLPYAYIYPTAERARAASRLLATAREFERVIFYSAGTEANEVALKLARLHGRKTGRQDVLAYDGCFHGKTAGSALLANRDPIRGWFGWTDPRVHHLAFPFAPGGKAPSFSETLREAEQRGVPLDKVIAFFVEPFQGWHSSLLPTEYARELRDWTKARGILLVFDEVQSGFGRTGAMFAFQKLGIVPDILTLGKGLTGGFPMSAILGATEIMDVDPLTNSTHSGNPMGCAAISATLEVFERERLLERVPVLEGILRVKLEGLRARWPKQVRWCSGVGMTWSLFCQDPTTGEPSAAIATRVLEEAFRSGVLITRYGVPSVIKLAPPLVISPEALEEALTVLTEVFERVVREADGAAS